MAPLQDRFPSPLRYPGGKGKIANFLKVLFSKNRLAGYSYAEPYAGGASVALHLLFEEYASRIYINDLNRSVHAFWRAVLNDTDALCARIQGARFSMAEWRRQRAVQEVLQPDDLDLAYSTFYLNRTNRSGIIWGGVIGGTEQKGKWGMSARFNKTELVERVTKIANYADRISLTGIDAVDFLRRPLPDRTFIYLDPPYYIKGAGLYENFYRHADHESVAVVVRGLKQPWIVSYDDTPEIRKMYRGWRRRSYGLHYSAHERYRGDEIMFFAERLKIPTVHSPANIDKSIVRAARLSTIKVPRCTTTGRLHITG